MPSPASRPLPLAEPDPMRVWFRFVRLHRRAAGAVAAALKEIGLSIPQFDLLSTLTEQEGLSQQELAERLYVTKGNVSGLVDRMVEAGLVERRASPDDRRSNALHLTERGRDGDAARTSRSTGPPLTPAPSRGEGVRPRVTSGTVLM